MGEHVLSTCCSMNIQCSIFLSIQHVYFQPLRMVFFVSLYLCITELKAERGSDCILSIFIFFFVFFFWRARANVYPQLNSMVTFCQKRRAWKGSVSMICWKRNAISLPDPPLTASIQICNPRHTMTTALYTMTTNVSHALLPGSISNCNECNVSQVSAGG